MGKNIFSNPEREKKHKLVKERSKVLPIDLGTVAQKVKYNHGKDKMS